MIKDPNERPKATQLLKHPFVYDIDYEEAKEEYLGFKYKVLRDLGTITDDYEDTKFEGFEQNHTVGRGGRSKTIKSIKKKVITNINE
jgi:hypothetical protein